MAFEPTAAQQAAIDARGNILVSAAAGSGKTAVLVERVIKMLTDESNPVNADRLLIVTFTNAAAAEMRTRIEKRLDAECRANPDNIGLLRQRQQLNNAKICTIDSFCIDLVRENFERAGVSPDFKMSDGYSLRPTDEAVLKNVLERYYEENNPIFLQLLDTVGAEYDDGNFSAFVLKIYDYSRQLAFPKEWFAALPEAYKNGFGADNEWYKYAVESAVKTAADMQALIAEAADICLEDEKTAEKYLPDITESAKRTAALANACNKGDWDEIYNSLNAFSLSPLPRANGLAGAPQAAAAKLAYKYLEKDIERLQKLFYADSAFISAQLNSLYPAVRLLSEILTEFDEKLFAEYSERGTFTFHNTEHMALRLLCEAEKAPDDELLKLYDEVMVDEYQDTNDLQDTLFHILSHHGERLFAVGDVKQSIYGFRGADPSNFLRKKNAALPYDKAGESEPKKIILGSNFRCRAEVCRYINFFFEHMMTENTGSIAYNEEERLIPAAKYPETAEPPAELDIISAKGSAEERLIAEARHIAEYIKSAVNGKPMIREDEKNLRPAKFSDFTILLRSPKYKAGIIAKELRKHGVPANFSAESFAETTEISVFLALLKVIDNPESDIELLCVLLSSIFGFTPEETANLRINRRCGSLYSALVFAAENGDVHAKNTLDTLQKYRLLSVTLPLSKLIMRLLGSTDYLNTVSAGKEGLRRRNNLLLLASYAAQYEADTGSGIGGFVRFILKQSESGIKSAAAGSAGDTVNIMSIHASKGLQFPVCIVADTTAAFNDGDAREDTLFSAEHGIGFRYFDEAAKTRFTTICREVIIDKQRKTAKEEELRLLYVAMTRTQDKLMLISSVSDAEKEIAEEISALTLCGGRPDRLFSRFKSYAKWLLVSALLHPDGRELRGNGTNIIPDTTESRLFLRVIYPEPENAEEKAEEKEVYAADNDLTEKIRESISFEYPYAPLLQVEAKSSVSALANKAESDKFAFSARPAFMSKGGITAAERGTATHRVMEFIDFNKAGELDAELERLYEWQYLSEREYNAVPRDKIKAFFESDIFARIKKSPLVKREMRFLTELPANKLLASPDKAFENEKIIVQGAVDLCFEEDGEIVVLDFKTDHAEDGEALRAAYGGQLAIYALACEKIFEKPVKQTVIYSFALSKEINV